jgi:hypothetical protein
MSLCGLLIGTGLLVAGQGSANAVSDRATAVLPGGAVAGAFVENLGQWPEQVLFLGRFGGIEVRVEQDSVWFQALRGVSRIETVSEHPAARRPARAIEPESVRHHSIRLSLEGGAAARAFGMEPTAGSWSFLDRPESDRIAGARGFGQVLLSDVLPGVDWILMQGEDGRPRFDFKLDAGIDPGVLSLRVEGSESLRLTGTSVRLSQDNANWSFGSATALQESRNERREVNCDWSLGESGELGFNVSAHDGGRPLTIDPSVEFSSFLGGTLDDWVDRIHVDEAGVATLTGLTFSPQFPITPGVVAPDPPFDDLIFVAQVAAGGRVPVFSTVLGQTDSLSAADWTQLGVVGDGVVVAYGNIFSAQPTPGAYVTPFFPDSREDIVVTKLSASGSKIIFTARIGGSDRGYANGLFTYPDGRIVVYGLSNRDDMPVQFDFQPLQTSILGRVTYVAELSADGSELLRSVAIGGDGEDEIFSSSPLPGGGLLVGGRASSDDFPVTADAFQGAILPSTVGSDSNGWWARLSPGWDSIEYASYLSTSGFSRVLSVQAVGDTAYWIVARADGADLPFPPGVDVQELDPGAFPVLLLLCDQQTDEVLKARWATSHSNIFLSSTVADVDGGLIYVGSSSPDSSFPFLTPGEPFGPPGDVTISKLDPLGDHWVWSYGFGGSTSGANGTDTSAFAMWPAGPERLALAGATLVEDMLVTPGVIDTEFTGSGSDTDGWFAELDLKPTGFERLGEPTNACNGDIRAGIRRLAIAGDAEFGLSCIGAPRNAPGVLARSAGLSPVPIDVGGVAVQLDLGHLFLTSVQADGLGWAGVDLPLTGVPAGVKAYFQFAWVDPGTCGSVGALSASDAIGVEVQP